MKTSLTKNQIKYIFFSVVGVLIIAYFIYQVVQMNTNPYKTEIAIERQVQSTISTKAFIVRDETYITASNTSGTIVSIAEDGKRVASGDDVAVVFQDGNSAATYVRIRELEKEIETLELKQAEYEELFTKPEIYSDTEKMLKIQAEYNEIKEKLDNTMEEWMELSQ